MILPFASAITILSGLTAAAPFKLPNGFPFSSIQDPALKQVYAVRLSQIMYRIADGIF